MSHETIDHQLNTPISSPAGTNTFKLSADQWIERSPNQDLLLTTIATIECCADEAEASLLNAIGGLSTDAKIRMEITLVENISVSFPECLHEDDVINGSSPPE